MTEAAEEDDVSKWFVLESFREVVTLIQEYEVSTVTKFSVWTSDKNFGNIEALDKNHKIRWNDETQDFNGVPFMILGKKVLDCQNGKDRKEKAKEEKRKGKKFVDHDNKRCKKLPQDTKKFGCKAQIKIKEVLRFPNHKIDGESRYRKEAISKRIRNDLTSNPNCGSKCFLICLPSVEEHSHHAIGENAGFIQPIDNRLIQEIHKNSGTVREVGEMRRILDRFVTKELFTDGNCPSRQNKRFFPRHQTIRSHMVGAIRKQRYSKIDQECLEKKIEEWAPQDPSASIFFRPTNKAISHHQLTVSANSDDDDEEITIHTSPTSGFVFIYQNEWMKRLLLRYGNEMFVLDAAYKTLRYALPLFFVLVKTNVDYQTVAAFVVESESTENLHFAMQVIKSQNPDFNPQTGMVGSSNEEIDAVESLYPHCDVLISDFHREQAWEHWLSAAKNGCTNIKKDVLCRIRRIARAKTEEDLKDALDTFHSCEHFRSGAYKKMTYQLEIFTEYPQLAY